VDERLAHLKCEGTSENAARYCRNTGAEMS
jgi:hypothetical protein